MPKITPTFMVNFETEVRGTVVENWQRVSQNLVWDRFMKQRPASTKTQILTWLLETTKIYPEGYGGNKRFDDILSASYSIEIEDYGAGLRLLRNEIEDNQMAKSAGTPVGALDYAAKWAKDVSFSAAYHPQESLFKLIKNGTVGLCYDGLPFFSKVHPVTPGTTGGQQYSNIVENVPLVVVPAGAQNELDVRLIARRNLGKAIAHVRKQRFYNSVPRYLKPTVLGVPTDLFDYACEIVGAGIISQTTNTIEKLEVVCAPELDDEPTAYYIGVEDMANDEIGAFLYSERAPFSIQMYGPQDDAVLNRMKEFEWTIDGRNTSAYGHPYLFYKCYPGAAP